MACPWPNSTDIRNKQEIGCKMLIIYFKYCVSNKQPIQVRRIENERAVADDVVVLLALDADYSTPTKRSFSHLPSSW